jgi:DNA-binding Lrp family transcriptional regulator
VVRSTGRMKLSRNEQRILNCLLANGRMSNTEIGKKLGVTSQAVGRIRRKLERDLISKYSVDLHYEKAGLTAFALAMAKITRKGQEEGIHEVERLLHKDGNVISAYRIPYGDATHLLQLGFPTMEALNTYFSEENQLNTFLDVQQLFTFSHHSIIKENKEQLFQELIRRE